MSDEAEDARYVGFASEDGSSRRFLARVGYEVFKRGGVLRFLVSANVWQAIAHETDYGTLPGSRMRDQIEIMLPGGYVAVVADAGLAKDRGEAEIADGGKARLDFSSLV
jgi:hypothetical protein